MKRSSQAYLALACLLLAAFPVHSQQFDRPSGLGRYSEVRTRQYEPGINADVVGQRFWAAKMQRQSDYSGESQYPELLRDSNLTRFTSKLWAGQQQVIPGGEGTETQSGAFVRVGLEKGVKIGEINKKIDELGVNKVVACSKEDIQSLDAAQKSVAGRIIDDKRVSSDERLYRLLLRQKESERETQESLRALKSLEDAWRNVISHCFQPLKESKAFADISNRVGAFSVDGGVPFCTGTLIQNGKILTARHCFFDYSDDGKLIIGRTIGLSFSLANASTIISIESTRFSGFEEVKYRASDDWLVLDVPELNDQITPMQMAKSINALIDMRAVEKNKIPTRLEIFSVVPLAKILEPALYPAAIAGIAPNACYVVYQQETCFSHTCSAVPGGSGASLFLHDSPSLTWAGLHTGPETSEGGTCSNNTSGTNYAVRNSGRLSQYFVK